MNSALQKQVTNIQNMSLLAAHKIKLPKRFKENIGPTNSHLRITDTKTNKSITISINNRLVVRRVLNTFFGD